MASNFIIHYGVDVFRCENEARWAVFFNELAIDYTYETDEYDMGSTGIYMPYFYLTDIICRVVIADLKKPLAIGEDDDLSPEEGKLISKIERLIYEDDVPMENGLLITGKPWPGKYQIVVADDDIHVPEFRYCEFHMCHDCGALLVGADGIYQPCARSIELCANCHRKGERLHPDLERAFTAARDRKFLLELEVKGKR